MEKLLANGKNLIHVKYRNYITFNHLFFGFFLSLVHKWVCENIFRFMKLSLFISLGLPINKGLKL